MKSRGSCGAAPMQPDAFARAKADDEGPYADLKSIVMGASAAVALMKIRRCPYALARGAASAVRAARRVGSGLWQPARATAGFLDLVEIATAETAHVHDLIHKEAAPNV